MNQQKKGKKFYKHINDHFEKADINPNGECGFTLIGVDRIQFYNILSQSSSNLVHIKKISEEIYDCFVDCESNAPKEFTNFLSGEDMTSASRFCQTKEAYEFYINLLLLNSWCGIKTIELYCFIVGKSITIYTADENLNLTKVAENLSTSQDMIYGLFNNRDHFDLLIKL